jgi:hypothetical protein
VGYVAGVAAGALSFLAAPELGVLGIVLAEAIGLIGFLLVYLIMFVMGVNIMQRIFSMLGTFVVSETPFMDAIPVLSIAVWSDMRAQEKTDKAERKRYEAELRDYKQQLASKQNLAREAAIASLAEDAAQEEEIPGDAALVV